MKKSMILALAIAAASLQLAELGAATGVAPVAASVVSDDMPAEVDGSVSDDQGDTAANMGGDASFDAMDQDLKDFNFDSDEFEKMLKQLQEHMETVKANMPPDVRESIDRLENEMKELGTKLETLRSELAEFEALKAQQKEEVVQLRERLETMKKERDELVGKVAALTQEVQTLSGGEADERTSELAQKQQELEKMDADIASTHQSLEAKRQEKRETKAKIAAHTAAIEEHEATMNQKSEEGAAAFGGDQNIDFEKMFGDISENDGEAGFDNAVEPDELEPTDEDTAEKIENSEVVQSDEAEEMPTEHDENGAADEAALEQVKA